MVPPMYSAPVFRVVSFVLVSYRTAEHNVVSYASGAEPVFNIMKGLWSRPHSRDSYARHQQVSDGEGGCKGFTAPAALQIPQWQRRPFLQNHRSPKAAKGKKTAPPMFSVFLKENTKNMWNMKQLRSSQEHSSRSLHKQNVCVVCGSSASLLVAPECPGARSRAHYIGVQPQPRRAAGSPASACLDPLLAVGCDAMTRYQSRSAAPKVELGKPVSVRIFVIRSDSRCLISGLEVENRSPDQGTVAQGYEGGDHCWIALTKSNVTHPQSVRACQQLLYILIH